MYEKDRYIHQSRRKGDLIKIPQQKHTSRVQIITSNFEKVKFIHRSFGHDR